MGQKMDDLIKELEDIVGTQHVQTTGDLGRFEEDWRKRTKGKALAVVSPKNTVEVSQIVKACLRAKVSIVPQGGNLSLIHI